MSDSIASYLLTWYHQNKRILPWRDLGNPYAVWVSEIMLQQTRVDTVIAYFERWMDKFPTIESLADAGEQDVLNLWEGLGYYSRARNLHHAAKILVDEYDAQIPEDVKDLIKLPGIGPYTAAAISSMAFGHDAAAVDGNIRRVYARIFDIDIILGTKEAEKIFWDLAEKHLPKGEACDYNQALMDLGATICTPRNPCCEDCPINEFCKSYTLGNQEMRPVRKKKKQVSHHIHAAAVIVDAERGKVLLAQRPKKGLLGGMWEFLNGRVEGNPAEGLAGVIREGYQVQIHVGNPLCIIDHAYTHFKITEHAYVCTMLKSSQKENWRWVDLKELEDYPMGKIDREIAKRLQQSDV
ncbi:MAG: A/G-specific adenine glycosylase [Anaerolineae bacterium]|jgi:A/G-specific adenine glycosylase|nr:A/G-specific adenine glycosylase [Anaerolineae bacterium]MBT4131992.1 A/G-specific adenine glycosylase [Candidatus Neomarinimicrobiota bacterium]MBT3713847.1 A/G-specific adenine glycosylase [Anaerolineae bacterium]MBT4308937.1 A/G-specific adenine glycosylase [Anaerolineae bacterium]MBT4457389.1 A/G-specific adenine glycosylase [Anaerolineae bacterium]